MEVTLAVVVEGVILIAVQEEAEATKAEEEIAEEVEAMVEVSRKS